MATLIEYTDWKAKKKTKKHLHDVSCNSSYTYLLYFKFAPCLKVDNLFLLGSPSAVSSCTKVIFLLLKSSGSNAMLVVPSWKNL